MTVPPDEDVRLEVRTNLGETLFLEAGAGSGKTSCLVDRFVALVRSGVAADTITAITFTEQAAAELADRIRQRLQAEAQRSPACAAALDVLDRAAISTLHAFAQRILVAHPVESGVPPRFEVLDEIASQLAFSRRWEQFVDRILDDPQLAPPLRMLAEAGNVLDQLRDLALAFGDNWDLVEHRLTARSGEPEPSLSVDVTDWCDQVDRLDEHLDACVAEDDTMRVRIGQLRQYATRLADAPDDESRFGMLLREAPSFKVARTGAKTKWRPAACLDDVRAEVTRLGAEHDALAAELVRAALHAVADAVGRFTVEAAVARRAEGRLEFHDLLVLARDLLRHPTHGWPCRQALRERHQRLLLDEFQDTDPIQVELAVLLASSDPGAGSMPWTDVPIDPGRLFLVGDPKQSIYRFRRADIGVFLDAQASLAAGARRLVANFRTVGPIVDWINDTFAGVLVEEPRSQPAYVPLVAVRDPAPSGPSVAFLGAGAHQDRPPADELRRREADDVAAACVQAVNEGWPVEDFSTKRWRPAGWRDLCILLPARTSLAALERALEQRDVPYRAETSSLVYATREVRDLLAVARAVDDPTDQLSLVTALRSAAFGCGDDDLYTWRVDHHGRFDHQWDGLDELPGEVAGHPVADALRWLRDVHAERTWRSPSQVLDRIVRDRRLQQIAFAARRPRDVLRRLRFVVDQARAWQETTGGGTLRAYLTWVELQSLASSRVVETVLPETDDESVRIMTIHGAKGLEFPVVLLSGLTTRMSARRAGVEVHFPPDGRGWAVKLGKQVSTEEYNEYLPIDEKMDEHERRRLLYVAATRAQDHLVVSAHRLPPRDGGEFAGSKPTAAELLWSAGGTAAGAAPLEATSALDLPIRSPASISSAPLPARADWQAERDAVWASGTRRLSISASRLAEELAASADAGLAKGARDLELPAWQKGRYGSAVGRAVHGVLQTVDLATGEGLADLAAAQAVGEGVAQHTAVVAGFARSALGSDLVRAAARAPHWREVYVGAPLDDLVLEGYLDLLFRGDDGALVIVDYKTDPWSPEAVERYRPQLDAYRRALEAVLVGDAVGDAVALFLDPAGGPATAASIRRFER